MKKISVSKSTFLYSPEKWKICRWRIACPANIEVKKRLNFLLALRSQKEYEKRHKKQFVFYNDSRVYLYLLKRGLIQAHEIPNQGKSKWKNQHVVEEKVRRKSCDLIRNRSMDNLCKGLKKWSIKKHLDPMGCTGKVTDTFGVFPPTSPPKKVATCSMWLTFVESKRNRLTFSLNIFIHLHKAMFPSKTIYVSLFNIIFHGIACFYTVEESSLTIRIQYVSLL